MLYVLQYNIGTSLPQNIEVNLRKAEVRIFFVDLPFAREQNY